ncbi:MAG TPA: branched-chain amino acid ABC transporter permease [Candidatus Caldiarchaeum subterraneum]|uniref:Branched-chain amino acid ABC transporter permease n=1 Tax=Caldiarchaeum subterraneum TaxID=311458 RepID=A0A833E9M8_CALS0|nr:branched-chain amino acid ABC transporter permease [Candidatus Caldarchaeum subterraneum]
MVEIPVYLLAQVFLWGLINGSIYVLLAAGLAIIFGVMKVINFAHGELMIIGAYLTFFASLYTGLNPYIAMLISVAGVAGVGVIVQRFGFGKIRGAAKINEIFLSIALILIFQNLMGTLIIPYFKDPVLIKSPLAGKVLRLGIINIRYDFITMIAITWSVMALLFFFLKKTDTGRSMRAVSQNRVAAQLMGVNVDRIDIISFAMGSTLAAVAGSLLGLITPFDPYTGTLPAIKAFAIIILGGLGSVLGAVVGGLIYGIAEGFAVFFLGGAWRDTVAFAILILVLLFRPEGLFREGA